MADEKDPFLSQMYQTLVSADQSGDTQQAEYIAGQIKQYQTKSGQADTQRKTQTTRQEALRQTVDSPAGQVYAGLQSFIDQIPFDLGNKAQDAMGSALDPNYDPTTRQDIGRTAQQMHPMESMAGSVAGFANSAAMLAPAAAGALAPKVGQAGLNVAKAAGVSGAMSAGETAARGGSAGDVAVAGGAGAIIGPVAGKVIGEATQVVARQLPRAWNLVAKKLGVSSSQLSQYIDEFERNTGLKPSIQQVLDSKAAGGLQKFARSNPKTGQILQDAERRQSAALPGQVSEALTETIPAKRPAFLASVKTEAQTPSALLNARDEAMDAAMAKVSNDPVAVPADLFTEPSFNKGIPRAMRRDIREAMQGIDLEADPDAVISLTVREADTIRRRLRRLQNSPANVGEDFGDLADEIGDIAAQQSPGYGGALEEYGKASKYSQGFEHSFASGADMGSAKAPDLRAALASAEGKDGHAAGYASYLRNQAGSSPESAASTARRISNGGDTRASLEAAAGQPAAEKAATRAGALEKSREATSRSTPGALATEEQSAAGKHLAYGGAQAAAGLHFSGAGHIGRAVFSYLSRHSFSEKVQNEIGEALTSNNPALIKKTLARLRKTETDAKALKSLMQALSGATGKSVGSALSPEEK